MMVVEFFFLGKPATYNWGHRRDPVKGDLVSFTEQDLPFPVGVYEVTWVRWVVTARGPQKMECELKQVHIR